MIWVHIHKTSEETRSESTSSMGAYLSEPVRDKETENVDGRNGFYRIGASSMQGWRCNMEDAHIADPGFAGDPDSFLCCVFDGHGGTEVAKFCEQQFRKGLAESK